MSTFALFSETIQSTIAEDTFVKITLSKPIRKKEGLRNIYVRLVLIQEELKLSFTYHYKTNDQVKNYTIPEGIEVLQEYLSNTFRTAVVFALKEDLQVFLSKKKVISYKKGAASFANKPPLTHDQPKAKRAQLGAVFTAFGTNGSRQQCHPKNGR